MVANGKTVHPGKQIVLGLGPKNELERSLNLATKTRGIIKFSGHIVKILRRII